MAFGCFYFYIVAFDSFGFMCFLGFMFFVCCFVFFCFQVFLQNPFAGQKEDPYCRERSLWEDVPFTGGFFGTLV